MHDQTMELLEKALPPIASTKDHGAGVMTRTSGPARRQGSTSASPRRGGGWRRHAKFQGARGRVQRIRFCNTRKHGGWLRISESELIALARQ